MDYLNFPKWNLLDGNLIYFLGMDDLNKCDTKIIENFLSYSYPISYKFNSRGFRDEEWPTDTSNVIWCVGDSFTKGIGIPYEHTWPYILEHKSGQRCINLGIDGASNQLIKRKCLQIIKEHNPKTIIPMWSFFHRRHEDPWLMKQHGKDLNPLKDFDDFINCFKEINNPNSLYKVVNLLIPNQKVLYQLPQDIKFFQSPLIDTGRDSYHFDYKTAEIYVEHILSKIS